MMMMMMFFGTETLVTQLVNERPEHKGSPFGQ